MVKRHNIILVGAVVVGLAGAGYLGWGTMRSRQNEAEQREHMSKLVATFKERCPPVKNDQRCFFEPQALENSARLHAASGEKVEAGVIYAKLANRQEDARRIAEECEKAGDVRGANRIRAELSIRANAIEEYIEQQGAATAIAQAAPKSSGSAAVPVVQAPKPSGNTAPSASH
ncbi:MAG: hypothetical protein V1861_01765 [Candidatus Micrarchaeota archaeon]